MELNYIKSATCEVKSNGVKLLMDPWILNGEYYGSWFHQNNKDINVKKIQKVNYIYISHIHPDHFSKKSLEFFNKKKTKIIIHKYAKPFLKFAIENLGFKVIELENKKKFYLNKNFFIQIFAADNCDPVLCAKHFGCEIDKKNLGSNQIDTLAIISNSKKTILNINDCPYEMSKQILDQIKIKYKIDLMIGGYSGAGPYPQCFKNLTKVEKTKKALIKKKQFLIQAKHFIEHIKPKYFMPFAGTYFLSGNLSRLNKYRGVPTRLEAKKFLSKNCKSKTLFFVLKTNGTFNLKNFSKKKELIADNEKFNSQIFKKLSSFKFDYQKEKPVNQKDIIVLLKKAVYKFFDKLILTGYKDNTKVVIKISKSKYFLINTKLKNFKISHSLPKNKFLLMELNQNLLYKILLGPRFAHWNNAEIGSHILYFRKPDFYDKKLFYCLNFFHS